MNKYEFSIIILTKNSLGIVNRLVNALLSQNFDYSYEVIFMDNSSTDETVKYLESTSFKDKRIFNVPEGEFSHSGTRMKAAELALGKFVIFFTDDIIPIGTSFLKDLTIPLIEDKVPATYGVFQINDKECDPIDAYLHNEWYTNFEESIGPISEFCWKLFPSELHRKFCNFDNCSSGINRELLLELKFPDVPYGEDMLFAKKLLKNGYKVGLSKDAKFFHWHKVSFNYMVKRMCIDQHLSIPEFNIYYVRRKVGVIKAVTKRILHRTYIAFFKLKIPIKNKFYWSFYNAKTLTADFIGKYMGVLDKDSIKGFSPINTRLLKRKNEIIDEISKKSIIRDKTT